MYSNLWVGNSYEVCENLGILFKNNINLYLIRNHLGAS